MKKLNQIIANPKMHFNSDKFKIHKLDSFSYPFGSYDDETSKNIVKEIL